MFLISVIASAQSFRLNGKVINQKNEPVPGATISVPGLERAVAADIEGRFSILLESGKKYSVSVSSVGYSTKMFDQIEVSAHSDNTLTVVLETKSTLAEVVVRTSIRRESSAALLNLQRNNPALSSGISADFIRRTPDKNTGDVLKRVSGASIQENRFVIVRGLSDRYNAALINNAQFPSTEPDRKAFSFDIIPSILIDNIIINKTATPDLTGEFAGGLIQVQTKDVPSRNALSVGISMGFNTQSFLKDFYSNARNGRDWIGFDDGTRNIPNGFPASAQEYRGLGASNAGVQKQLELTRLFNNDVYTEKKRKAGPVQTYNLTWGNASIFKNGAKFGTILSLIYRKSLLINDVERRLNENDGTINTQFFDKANKYTVNTGAIANFTYVSGKHKISFKNLFNQLFDDNYYTRTGMSIDRLQEIDFRSSILNQRSLYSGQLEGEHQLTKSGIIFRWNGNVAYNWKSQPDLRTSSYFRSQGSSTPFENNNDDTRRFFSDLKDYSYGANGSLTIPFKMGNEKQTLKTGGSTLMRIRDFRSRIFRYDPANVSQFDASKNFLRYDQIYRNENIAPNGFVLNEFTNNQDKYFGVSALDAAYVMLDNKFSDQIRLVWGVRAEYFGQFLTTKDPTAKRIVVNTEKWDILPSLNFTFSPTPKQNIRVSGSRTVSRPEFREIAPFSFYDYEVNYAINGNPNLKRGSILNGDIRYEYYPKGGEGVSIGVFYKQFTDPIEFRLNPSSVIDRRTYEYQNADKATSIGGEFEIRKGLDFVNTNLSAFSVFANLTYIYSKVTLKGTSGSGVSSSVNRPLQGQSPYLINVGLQYNGNDGNWNSSLLYNRIGQRLALVGISELGFADVYERPRDQIDLQIARKLFNKRGELKLTWADILNQDFYFYENIDSKKAFKNNTDRLFFKYSPGSTITLGFTYDFNL